jgi:hypothetical protein
VQTAPPIPQTVARHVLWHFGREGGIEPGTFIARLLDAIAAADMVNTARLAEGFPEYVAAVVGAQMDPDGITNLQKIAAGKTCIYCEGQDGPFDETTGQPVCEGCLTAPRPERLS